MTYFNKSNTTSPTGGAECLYLFQKVHPWIVREVQVARSLVFYVMLCRPLLVFWGFFFSFFVFFFLLIWSLYCLFFPRCTDSDYPFGISKYVLHFCCKTNRLAYKIDIITNIKRGKQKENKRNRFIFPKLLMFNIFYNFD